MLDARNIFRKVTRKIFDFSPEQMENLAAIVWLYRGQRDRFLGLVKEYLGAVCAESAADSGEARGLREHAQMTCASDSMTLGRPSTSTTELDADKKQALAEAVHRIARCRQAL